MKQLFPFLWMLLLTATLAAAQEKSAADPENRSTAASHRSASALTLEASDKTSQQPLSSSSSFSTSSADRTQSTGRLSTASNATLSGNTFPTSTTNSALSPTGNTVSTSTPSSADTTHNAGSSTNSGALSTPPPIKNYGHLSPSLLQLKLEATTRALCKSPHRLAGSSEAAAAREFLKKELLTLQNVEILEQPFLIAQNVTLRCELETGREGRKARTLPLLPLRPNGIIPPTLPEEGVTAKLITGGDGTWTEDPAGKIVALEYNCGTAWLRAFRLGARAVIFCAPELPDSQTRLHSYVNVNLPRFYFQGKLSELPLGRSVTLRGQSSWRAAEGNNLYVWLPGTNATRLGGAPETLILATPLDSFGEVPERSPSARAAANAALLLECARSFSTNRPARNLLLAFLDNEARGHSGAAALYRTLAPANSEAHLPRRKRVVESERETHRTLAAQLSSPGALLTEPVKDPRAVRLLRAVADHRTDSLREAERALRMAQRSTEPLLGPASLTALTAQFSALREERHRWDDFKRAMQRRRTVGSVTNEALRARALVLEQLQRSGSELDRRERMLEADSALSARLLNQRIVLHSSLLLGDNTARWGIVAGGNAAGIRSEQDAPGLYGKVQNAGLNAARALAEQGSPLHHFETATVDGSLWPPDLFFAGSSFTHSGEIAGCVGVFNIALVTAQEQLPREGTPLDTVSRIQFSNLATQSVELISWFRTLADSPALSMQAAIVRDGFFAEPQVADPGKIFGPSIFRKGPGAALADLPAPGAVVQIYRSRETMRLSGARFREKQLPGFDEFQVRIASEQGMYDFGPVPTDLRKTRGFAARFDEAGQVTECCSTSGQSAPSQRIELFPVQHGFAVIPPQLDPDGATIYEARANAAVDSGTLWSDSYDGVVSWFCDARIPAVKLEGGGSLFALNLGQPAQSNRTDSIENSAQHSGAESYGTGFKMENWKPFSSALQSATDMLAIDSKRRELLEQRGIFNASLDRIHRQAQELLDEARATPRIDRAEALASSAYLVERHAYWDSRQTIQDLVTAVLLLLVLNVPFAFAMERLLIGAPNVYQQAGWYVTFFLAGFLALYAMHPAFSISAMPLTIFLGFVMALLSGLVMTVLLRRFETVMKGMQGLGNSVHTADVSRFDTVLAAMQMGISTMRRRPLRTALTAATVVLLTYTLLVFASFERRLGFSASYTAPSPGYHATLIRRPGWQPMNDSILSLLQDRWATSAILCRRIWRCPEAAHAESLSPALPLSAEDGATRATLRGVLGLDPQEFLFRPALSNLLATAGLNSFSTNQIWLTEATAARLAIRPGDTVLLGGLTLKLAGLLDPGELLDLADMDESSILPADLSVPLASSVRAESSGAARSWTALPPDSIAITHATTALTLGGTVRALHFYTEEPSLPEQLARDMTLVIDLPVYATRPDGVHAISFGTVLHAGGLRDVLFPLLLGSLVVFGTMLGSVSDREREIFTFSALGLAPVHVAGLFFAEALVYAVIGGMGGYLLAQAGDVFLGFLATYGLVRVPEMNFSSVNAILTILLVIFMVLGSAIYPALLASRSANPGVLRKWRLPEPVGDELDVLFPFTVSAHDFTGVISFLKEHFQAFGDTGLGRFMATRVTLYTSAKGELGLRARVALAPFDLGVTQTFFLRAVASPIPGIDQVRIELKRLSGQPDDWHRLNRAFIDELRKQFLIWRSLDPQTTAIYAKRTESWLQSRTRASAESSATPSSILTTPDAVNSSARTL